MICKHKSKSTLEILLKRASKCFAIDTNQWNLFHLKWPWFCTILTYNLFHVIMYYIYISNRSLASVPVEVGIFADQDGTSTAAMNKIRRGKKTTKWCIIANKFYKLRTFLLLISHSFALRSCFARGKWGR